MVQVTHLRDGTYFGRLFVKKVRAVTELACRTSTALRNVC